MTVTLAPIPRPDGRLYRPRKVVAHRWENEDGDCDCGAVVLGTHDVERARTLAAEACAYWFGCDYAIQPTVGWWRLGYAGAAGEPCWISDPVRGRAGVFFTASQDDIPEGTP